MRVAPARASLGRAALPGLRIRCVAMRRPDVEGADRLDPGDRSRLRSGTEVRCSSYASDAPMPIHYPVPPEHLPTLHAIQKIIFDARPPLTTHLPWSTYRAEWRCAAIRKLYAFAAVADDVAVVPDSFSCTIFISGVAYKLMTTRERRAPAHVDYRSRLRTNPHSWLRPAANQLVLFGTANASPGSDEMPVPLAFDPKGDLQVGWPDEVDPHGVGWGMEHAAVVSDLPMLIVVEPEAPAPEEVVPPLIIPPLKKVDDPDD